MASGRANQFAFLPDRSRGARLDRDIRAGLADSLDAVSDALGSAGLEVSALRRIAGRVRYGPCPPQFFALHSGLIEAILDEDASRAEQLLAGAGRIDCLANGTGIEFVTIDDATLGFPGAGELYGEIAIDDPEIGVALAPLHGEELAAAGERARSAFRLLSDAAPSLATELDVLVRQVVLVRTAKDSARDFGGASSFHLWGAVLLNALRYQTPVEIAEGLVHEAAHLVLFGESQGEPIVLNDEAERHVSPLRDDPRPLDGIAHATFVLARMTYCVEALLKSGLLAPAERDEAEEALVRNRRDYADGASVVQAHAILTDAGARMLDAAAAYMKG